MKTREVRRLIPKFEKGLLSFSEEIALYQFFQKGNVPEDLYVFRDAFLSVYTEANTSVPLDFGSQIEKLLDTLAEEENQQASIHRDMPTSTPVRFRRGMRKERIWIGGIAASLVLILCIGTLFYAKHADNKRQFMTQSREVLIKTPDMDAEGAYLEAEKALQMVSSRLNKALCEVSVAVEPIRSKPLKRKKV